ncbi:MAG: hypothetical protein K0R14_798 [Burkholderiales bacterium]|jgi:hypothetical protein|nr:hypothetical protein [Burkholderiales bacterium]
MLKENQYSISLEYGAAFAGKFTPPVGNKKDFTVARYPTKSGDFVFNKTSPYPADADKFSGEKENWTLIS